MAIQTTEPILATFIHVPKTGGTSVQKWLFKNFTTDKRAKHCSYKQALETYGDLGWTYAVVRNPWARVVSAYFFSIEQWQLKLDLIDNGTIQKPWKLHNTREYVESQLEELNKGFNHFVFNGEDPLLLDPQVDYVRGVDYVMKLDNIQEEFKVVQEKLNCFKDLPHKNGSSHNHYSAYYNKNTRRAVEERYKADIEIFDFKFEKK
jgi:hypothetical protein